MEDTGLAGGDILSEPTIDPVCLSHGVPWSANPPHWAGKCLICQLCFKVLNSTADCNPLENGSYEDVYITCASEERAQQELINQQ